MNKKEKKDLIKFSAVVGAVATTGITVCDLLMGAKIPVAEVIKNAAVTFAMMSGSAYIIGWGEVNLRGKRH